MIAISQLGKALSSWCEEGEEVGGGGRPGVVPLLPSLNPEVSNVVRGYTLVSGPIRQLKCYSVSLGRTQHNTRITSTLVSARLNTIKPTGCREGQPRRGSPRSAAGLLVHTANI